MLTIDKQTKENSLTNKDLIYLFCELSKTINKLMLENLTYKIVNKQDLTQKEKQVLQVIKKYCKNTNNCYDKLHIQEFAKNLGISHNIDLVENLLKLDR